MIEPRPLNHRTRPTLLFLSGLVLIYIASLVVVGMPEFDRGDALPFALTVDLTLTIPVLFYFLMIRRAGLPPFSLVPVFIASVLVATAILPDDREDFLILAKVAGAIAEGFLVVYVLGKAVRFQRRLARDAGPDPMVAIRRAVRDVMGEHRVTNFVAAEAAILYLAFFSWRRNPVADTDRAFSYHRNSGWLSLVLVLGFFALVEMIFVHILVSRLNPAVAWVLSGLGVYGLIWMVGDYRAMCLRPIVLGPRSLSVRVGLRWEAEISLASIEGIRIVSSLETPPPDYLNAAVLGQPSVLITLRDEGIATGLFGVRRGYRTLGLSIDDPGRFRDRVEGGVPELATSTLVRR